MRWFWLLVLSLSILASSLGYAKGGTVSVKGYVRKDGTYVAPHHRTAPNSTKSDNWSTLGNVNPYTGKEGTIDPYGSSYPAARAPAQPAASIQAAQTFTYFPIQPAANTSSRSQPQVDSFSSAGASAGILASSPPLNAAGQSATRGTVWKYYAADGTLRYTSARPDNSDAVAVFSYIETPSGEAWRFASNAADGTEMFVHTQSVRMVGTIAKGWVLMNFPEAQRISKGLVMSQAERWTVDCDSERISTSDAVSYSGPYAGGDVIQTWTGDTTPIASVPGSNGYVIGKLLCKGPSTGVRPE